ncbi:hypothetical protein AGMMS49965_19680 [Bacteroidia bacterium]|nr:hypothetical protein AGMMS49965_19680 [Bacteroidia bacterium]
MYIEARCASSKNRTNIDDRFAVPYTQNLFTNILVCIALMISISFPSKLSAQNVVSDVDSLGTIWIVTVDKSGSMLTGTSAAAMAANVYNRLSNNGYLDKIDYTKDHFLFFCSGYMPDYYIGEGNSIATDTRFDSCFIHHTDKQLHYMKDKFALIAHIKDIISANDYKYKLSFVSQIRVFSLVKAIEFLKFQNENQNFNEVNIVTITDDADPNDQWMKDYRNLKKIDKSMKEKNKTEINGKPVRNKIEEISKINARYIYTELNSKGFGKLDEIFSDEDNSPHIWIYKYATKQSQPINVTLNLLDVLANDGKQVVLTPLSNSYISISDSICFYHIDSIKINNTIHKINQQFSEQWQGNMNYENGLHYNDIKLYGNFQILYADSIYGEHYKKVYFTQQAELPSVFLVTTTSIIVVILAVLLAIFLIYWLLILPNKKLFVIYSNQGKKYVVKRGYKHQWTKGTIPVLSCVLNDDDMSVICKKHRNMKTKTFTEISETTNRFLICSREKLALTEIINTKTDIEDFYNTRSGDYSNLLKHIYRKTLLYKCREHCCNSSHKWIRKIGNLYVKIDNFFNTRYFYSIPAQTSSDVSFRCPTLRYRKFVLEIEKARAKQNAVSDMNQVFNIDCLNRYYDDTPNKKYDALICYGTINNIIYWHVLLPEYEKDDSNSLRFVYNTYQYRQELSKNTEQQIPQNLKLLKKVMRKQIKNWSKIKVYRIDAHSSSNKHQFEIMEVSCPGFVYLIEDTEKQNSQMLYSPFKDGLKVKKDVFVRKFKTENCHLYFSFLSPSLIKGDTTLMKKVSEELVKTTESCYTVLKIENKKQIIFKNINTVI